MEHDSLKIYEAFREDQKAEDDLRRKQRPRARPCKNTRGGNGRGFRVQGSYEARIVLAEMEEEGR